MSATTKSIAAVVVFGVAELTLLLYSFCHPSLERFADASLPLGSLFYLAVCEYHARKMRQSGKGPAA